MASVNTFCRCSYKTQNRIFENDKTFRISNGRLDMKEFFKKSCFILGKGRVATVLVIYEKLFAGINLERLPGLWFFKIL